MDRAGRLSSYSIFIPSCDPHTGSLLRLVPGDLAWSPAGQAAGLHSYDEVLPLMLARYCGPGLLGLGITALIAGFMSGMAGNVSAFATVWTYDIYGALINKKASDESKVKMGRWCTLLGVGVSIGTAVMALWATVGEQPGDVQWVRPDAVPPPYGPMDIVADNGGHAAQAAQESHPVVGDPQRSADER